MEIPNLVGILYGSQAKKQENFANQIKLNLNDLNTYTIDQLNQAQSIIKFSGTRHDRNKLVLFLIDLVFCQNINSGPFAVSVEQWLECPGWVEQWRNFKCWQRGPDWSTHH